MIFQMLYTMLFQGCRKTPLQTLVAQVIQDICKSKQLITAFNHMYLCSSYEDMERIDIGLAKRLICLAGDNRVPVSPSISSSSIVHGVMDNWDHQEHTLKKSEGSHDMIFIQVQNKNNIDEPKQQEKIISVREEGHASGVRSLEALLPCQTLLKPNYVSERGNIPSDFVALKEGRFGYDEAQSSDLDYKTWEC